MLDGSSAGLSVGLSDGSFAVATDRSFDALLVPALIRSLVDRKIPIQFSIHFLRSHRPQLISIDLTFHTAKMVHLIKALVGSPVSDISAAWPRWTGDSRVRVRTESEVGL